MKLRPLSIGLATALVHSLAAQDLQGVAHGNYAGTDAVPMNPARLAGQWPWMDVNIIGADLFIRNDHVYVSGRDRTLLGEMRESMRTAASDGFLLNEALDGGERRAFVQARVKGPALALSLGRDAIGVQVSTRAALSVTGVGNDVARYAYNGLGYAPQHGTRFTHDRLRLTAMAWTEIGVSYARQIVAQDFHRLSAGLTAKYVMGHGAAALALNALDYTVLDTARLRIDEASGNYGIAWPAVHAGTGAGLDLGITYEHTLEEADGHVPHATCDPLAYSYRLGFSILDLGGVRFKDAMSGEFDASTAAFNDYETIQVNGEEGVDSLFRAAFSRYFGREGIGVGLPTAASLQFDKRIVDHVFIAADVVQNLSFPNAMRLRRPNTVSIVPRVEFKRFEAAVPFTFHEYRYQHPGVGLMLRLNNLVLGGDNLFPWITRGSMYGTDLYFRIKWTIFRSPACKGKKGRKHRAGDMSALPCTLSR